MNASAMSTGEQRLEMRAVAALRPYAGNARTHSKAQIRQIADSIRRFGFTNPVLVSDDGEIVAGHGRVLCGPAQLTARGRTAPAPCAG
jgi:ParB-like nuclease domain